MKTLIKLALISIVFAMTSCTKTETITVTNSPPNDSLLNFKVSINHRSLDGTKTDTLVIDSAQGLNIEASWKQTTSTATLYVRISDSLGGYKYQSKYGEENSHQLLWASSDCPKKGWFKAYASAAKNSKQYNAYIIITN